MNTHFLRHFKHLFKHLFLGQGGIPVTILSPSTKTLNVISGILIEFCNNCDSCGENIPSMKLGLLPLWHCWIWNYDFIGKRNGKKWHAKGQADKENNIQYADSCMTA